MASLSPKKKCSFLWQLPSDPILAFIAFFPAILYVTPFFIILYRSIGHASDGRICFRFFHSRFQAKFLGFILANLPFAFFRLSVSLDPFPLIQLLLTPLPFRFPPLFLLFYQSLVNPSSSCKSSTLCPPNKNLTTT